LPISGGEQRSSGLLLRIYYERETTKQILRGKRDVLKREKKIFKGCAARRSTEKMKGEIIVGKRPIEGAFSGGKNV